MEGNLSDLEHFNGPLRGMVFADGVSSELATLAGSVAAGYTATITIGVPA